jgi:hypothetical protein
MNKALVSSKNVNAVYINGKYQDETMSLNLNEKETFKILNGQTINIAQKDGLYLIEDEIDVVAIVQIKENVAKMHTFLG